MLPGSTDKYRRHFVQFSRNSSSGLDSDDSAIILFLQKTMRTLSNWKYIGSQVCGELCVGGHEVGGDEVPEGEQGDEGGQEGAREEEDLVR